MSSSATRNLPEFLRHHEFGGPGNPGSAASRSFWLCGIEYGESPNQRGTDEEIQDYSVAMQWRNWTYNRNAFKLISVVEGQSVDEALSYAEQRKIFESRTSPYFQTNLFPVECRTLETWSGDAQLRSGFSSKQAYIEAIRSSCFEQMHQQVWNHHPRLFVGVGITHVEDFSRVVFGKSVDLERHEFSINGHRKTLYLRSGEVPFAVVPHLSSPSGLNSNEALVRAGEMIRALLK